MSSIDHFVNFLFDEKRKLSSKATVVLFVILAVIVIDNILGFSFSFSTDKKIEQVQKLNIMLQDSATDSTTKIFVLKTRSEIMERKNIVVKALSILYSNKQIDTLRTTSINHPQISKDQNQAKKSNFWFNTSASGLYFICSILMIPVFIFSDKKTPLSQRLATGIAITISCALIGLFFIWILSFIPQIATSTWVWNYILNSLFQIGSLLIFYYLGDKT